MRRSIGTTAALAAALFVCAGAGEAGASGFALRENSAEALGTAFAGNASSATFLSTIFNNPAGMTEFTGDRAQVSASVIAPSEKFSGTANSTIPMGPSFPISGGNGGDAGKPGFVPAGYALHSFSPDLKVGIALTVPFGLKTEYQSDWAGRYFGIKSSIENFDFNPNIAYRVNDWLSIGGGVSANYLNAELTRAVDLNAATGNLPGTIPDANFRFKGDDWGFGFNFGALFKPSPDANIGVAYRSRVVHKLEGDADFSNVPCTRQLPLCMNPALFSSASLVSLNLPGNLDFSVTQKIGQNLRIAADVQWTNWSQIQGLSVVRTSGPVVTSVPEHFRDTLFASVGATYILDDTWTFRAGVAYDQSPVTDAYRTVALPDADRFWIALGIGYKISDGFSVDLGYAHIFIPGNASLNSSVNSNLTFAPSPFVDQIRGTYSSHVDLISLQTRFRF
ncbi:MAG TPA: outer membrane protein transport protein [Stellaceae bacterium]|nr:outer membrane protein transport protein [Stellaceae bacterium]